MKNPSRVLCTLVLSAVTWIWLSGDVVVAKPVIASHPRLLLTAADKTRLLAKKNANDPSWQALKARADILATYSIFPYKFATNAQSPEGTIFYGYQAENWFAAAMPLAFAYQMTNDTKYSNKLIQLAQEMIRAQSDPDNNPPNGQPPLRLDSYYPSRYAPAVLAFIYDYCYDQLSPTLKAQMVALMNDYFNDLKVNGYQAQEYSTAADGNYFGGHLYGAAMMGYASFGDNDPNAQHMIDWARIRFDGTPAATVPADEVPGAWRSQVFDGGSRPAVAFDFDGPDISGNPFKGGFDFQAWSYGSEEFGRMIDYMLTVNSATGEDLIAAHPTWFPQIFRAEKHALFPDRFLIDPTGDWGGFQGAVISRELPTRLAFLLAGTADGPGAQHFAYAEIAVPTIADVQVYDAPEWVEFFFNDRTRASTELVLPPYYTGFAPNYPQGATSPGGTNGAIPYFIMRSDWGASATWASAQMGSQWWDDHQHYHAGHIVLARGDDYLLVAASDWKGPAGGPGVLGGSNEALQSALANTLYFDDFGEYQRTDDRGVGGQSYAGIDQVVADELNQDFSYVRSDLSSAYNSNGDQAQAVNRRLEYFYRNFVYLRAPNVFVVYDQVKAKASTNPKGAYKKHIRWHLPNRPTVTGRVAQLDQGQSRLFIDTVLPANANLKLVDESSNPDPCDGSDPSCVPFADSDAGTWRVEVRDPLNPLTLPFLTVLQPGSKTSTAPVTTQIASLDGKMIGVEISQAGGARSIVLFNNQSGQTPAPITSTSYNLAGSSSVRHALLGLVPNAKYSVVLSGGVVSVNQSASGDKTASPSGALYFTLPAAVVLPTMALDRTSLRFGAVTTGSAFTSQTGSQTVRLTQSGTGAVTWTAVSSVPWLTVTPASGTGPAALAIAVKFAGGLPASGNVTGAITFTLTGAGNTVGPINVTLSLVSSTAAASPAFGVFDTPVGDATAVAGSIAVTGWTLDNIGVQRVELWRDLQPGETTPPFASSPTDPRTGKVFISNATFVDGARPDVEGLYPTTPFNYRAGWGYLLLTWGLWNQGNGTYNLYAFAFDQENTVATIGKKTVVVSNNAATKPFGSIDTPGIGADASGPNFGWALTPKVNGAATCKIQASGAQVSIDSGPLQPVHYGDLRSDIAGAFPGFSNSTGAGGNYLFDWSTLSNGPHTIGWFITDDCGRADGVGSRFFNVTTGAPPSAIAAPASDTESQDAITLARGYGELPVILQPGVAGSRTAEVPQGGRIEVRAPTGYRWAYQLGPDGQRRALPAGASWDASGGIFSWQPAVGFLGRYRIVFTDGVERISVRVLVVPPAR